MPPQHEVGSLLRQIGQAIEGYGLNTHQLRHLRAIKECRTAALGGHVLQCTDCQKIKVRYNSCRNRHCPKCQGHQRAAWIQRRSAELLPTRYFHVVFTLPHELNSLAMHAPAMVYNALFAAAWQTVNQFALTKGVRTGMVSVLHTWGQDMSLHPHLHCIIPGAGLRQDGQWSAIPNTSGKYFFHKGNFSKVFRAKYLAALRQAGCKDAALLETLYSKEWMVYAKQAFGSPQTVIDYLGRYTHRVAITNSRIVDIDEEQISFTYKDYRQQGKKLVMSLKHQEFVRRYAQHLLPHRFVRIRHYGILSSTWKRSKLAALQKQLRQRSHREQEPVTLLNKCNCCKKGSLVIIECFGKRGPPAEYLLAAQMTIQQKG